MQTTSTVSVALVQSRLFGGDQGRTFNDVEIVGGYPAGMTINVDNPISQVEVLYGAVVDGLSITYNETDGATETVNHGTEPGTSDTSLKRNTFTLSSEENIIAITGRAGEDPTYGTRICQINFVIYNSSTGKSSVYGPYGSNNTGTPFRVTANGAFIAFGGYAVTSNDSIAQADRHGRRGGLYGLTFADVAYRKA